MANYEVTTNLGLDKSRAAWDGGNGIAFGQNMDKIDAAVGEVPDITVMTATAPLAGGADLPTTVAAFNALIVKLKAAGLMANS